MSMIIVVKDLWANDNAFSILAKCEKAARKAGWKPERIKKFLDEAKSGDYDHLIQTTMKHFDEADDDDEE